MVKRIGTIPVGSDWGSAFTRGGGISNMSSRIYVYLLPGNVTTYVVDISLGGIGAKEEKQKRIKKRRTQGE